MGRKHAAAQAGIARAQAEEQVREAENRRAAAEEERQLLTSYLGSEDQVNGTGRFDVNPDVLRFTQRFTLDERALLDIQQAGAGVKNQLNPFQSADNGTRGGQDLLTFGRGFLTQANDLLAQAEAAARNGDLAGAEQLYQQAQQIISGVSPEAQGAYNLGNTASSSAAIRAGSAEGRIVGRQLLTARELGDPNSATSQQLRGRLLDPALTAVDENTRNAERAIAAERGEIEGQIRQQAASGGTGVNARAQLALQSRAASQAALERARAYTEAGQQKAALTAQVNLYLNEFAKRMAEDSVALAQDWVNGTAGVRDSYQNALTQLDLVQAEMSFQWAQMAAAQAERLRQEEKQARAFRREAIFGAPIGFLTAGGSGGPTGASSGVGAGGGGESAGGGGGGGGGSGLVGTVGSFFGGASGTAAAGSATSGGAAAGAASSVGSGSSLASLLAFI